MITKCYRKCDGISGLLLRLVPVGAIVSPCVFLQRKYCQELS